jgi:hypothetical protein
MKKIFSIIIIISIIFCSCDATNNKSASWTELDFAFYDFNGREDLFPTTDNYMISLDDIEDIQTYREVRIGDRATTALKKYNLKDFEYSICDLSELKAYSEKSQELDKQYKEQGFTIEDIISKFSDIAAKDLDIGLHCDIYKQDGKLCTLSELIVEEDNEKKTDDNSSFYFTHLKYSISFYISDEKIYDVYIDSHYHNLLNAKTLLGDPDWLKELGEE